MVSMFHTCAEYNQRAAAIESIRDGWSPAEFDCLGTRDQRWIRCCGQVQCVWGVWGGLCKPGEENTFPETRVKNCSNRGKRSGADAGAPGAIVEEMDYSGVSASEQCVRLRTTIEVAFTNMDGPLLKGSSPCSLERYENVFKPSPTEALSITEKLRRKQF